jgi:hypothetical protein
MVEAGHLCQQASLATTTDHNIRHARWNVLHEPLLSSSFHILVLYARSQSLLPTLPQPFSDEPIPSVLEGSGQHDCFTSGIHPGKGSSYTPAEES